MWRRAWIGLITGGGALMLAASPAGAKFWEFELKVDSTEIAAGETLQMEAVVAPYGVEQAGSNPAIVPPVAVYRTDDLPASGPLAAGIEPVEIVTWTNLSDGRFSGHVTLSEPGSYEIISMAIWNTVLEGYPQPISVAVTEPKAASVGVRGETGPLLGWSALIVVGAVTALVSLVFARRRSTAVPAG